MLARLLEHAGYEAFEARDAERAWALAHARRPPLVIAELYIPVRGAPCLVRPLKHADALIGLHVLVYTAHALEQDRRWALESGGDAFLAKPQPAETALGAVRSLLVT